MTDFLNELQADIQEENLFNLWRQYGTYVIGAMVAILLATGGYLLWNHYQQAELCRQSVQYQTAVALIQEKRPAQALQILDDLEKTQDGYSVLAQFQKIALKTRQILEGEGAQKGKFLREAFAPFTEGEKRFIPLKNLAAVELAFALLQTGSENFQNVEAYLTPQHPWKGLALELLVLQAFQEKNTHRVEELLEKYLYNRDVFQGAQARIALEAMGMGVGLLPPDEY